MRCPALFQEEVALPMGEVEKVRVQKTDAPAAADLPVCSKSALDTILLTEIDQASQSKTDRWTQLLAETWNEEPAQNLPRHLYQLALNVFYLIRRTCKTQAIIYSGFSGSGKSTSLRLADQISHLFLLLNSFTTAKTFQNPSAFRLSTLLKLHFDNLLHLVGAKLLVFGLERNHPSHYDLLSSSACYRIPDRPDADWLGQHLDEQSSRASADGIQIPKMDSQDHSPARIEMLRGGLMGGKADSKPGGIIGGLGKTSNSHRNSSDSFVSRLLSGPLLALDRHPLDPSVLVAAQVSSSPLRRPSPILPTHPHISLEPGSPRGAPLDSTVALIDTSVVQPTLSPMFSMRFRLEGTEANDLRRQLSIGLMLEENQDFAIGRSRVWPTFRAFQSLEERLSAEQPAGSQQRPIAGHLAGFDIPGGSPQELDSGGDLGGGGSGSYSHLIPSGSGNGDGRPNSGYEAERNIPQSPVSSRVWGSEWESKQPMEEQDMLSKEERYMDVGMIKHNQVGGQIEGNTNRDGATNAVLLKTDQNQTLEEVESSKARMWWVVIVWALTFYIPNFLLSTIGRMKRPDIQMAWREKVALCLIIFLMCGSVLFVILGLGKITCPNLAKAWTPNELGFHATESDFYVGVRGQVFDLAKFWRGPHSDITGQPVTNSDMLSLAVQDLTNYFPVPLKLACLNVLVDTVNLQFENWTATVPNTVHVSGSGQVVKASALGNDKWYTKKFLPFMTNFYKGPIVYTRKLIAGLADNRWLVSIMNRNPQFQYIDKSITDLFQQQPGKDITKEINGLPMSDADKSASLTCLRNLFYLGDINFRELPSCTVSNYILLAFTILIAAAVVAQFIAALQLGTKRMPELRDKFVISTLKYDDKRKLIFVICDGMIIRSGNDQPTPRIVCDLLGVDPSINPDPLLFQSVLEGSKQLNYGKVYSGLYEVDGHVVPYVVVAKVGKPSERSKPGNRGKRDSQILMMKFLNRVHFDAPMCPLELETCHQIKNVIGVDPQLYAFLIIRICGETKLSNEKVSWWTMIQVCEYYISHHLSKAFESLFGSVTCLLGCFTLYRICSADKGRPLVVSNIIIDEYAEIHVDTLHKKNLFSLGEDRFFTTQSDNS
ncbi:hypothetical protein H4Q26_018368 [Puccinia striiformis f. sp. tritici PST-130]|nr:hypothetical protein H4Q26_018368 [Puccinia striiformis f. sp. tritici PST-130]